jgi:outer membrane lipoprotein-sorting protein
LEVHDPAHPEYGRITMILRRTPAAPAGLMLQGWVALDSQNNRTTIRLSGQRFNAAIPDSAFRWSDPRARGPRG